MGEWLSERPALHGRAVQCVCWSLPDLPAQADAASRPTSASASQEKACLLLTAVLASRPDKAALVAAGPSTSASAAAAAPSTSAADEVQKAVASFIDWLCAQLRRPSDPARSVPTAVHALSQLLREPPMRVMLHRAGGVQLLAPLVAMPAPGSGQLNIQVGCWEAESLLGGSWGSAGVWMP